MASSQKPRTPFYLGRFLAGIVHRTKEYPALLCPALLENNRCCRRRLAAAVGDCASQRCWTRVIRYRFAVPSPVPIGALITRCNTGTRPGIESDRLVVLNLRQLVGRLASPGEINILESDGEHVRTAVTQQR